MDASWIEDEIDTARIYELCIQHGIGACTPKLFETLVRLAHHAKSLHMVEHACRTRYIRETVVKECRLKYIEELRSLDSRLHFEAAQIMWELIECPDPHCGPHCGSIEGCVILQPRMTEQQLHQEKGHDIPVCDAGVEEPIAGEIPRAPSSNPFDREFRQSFQDQLEEMRKDANHDRFTILWVLFALFLLSFGFATTRILVFVIVAGLAFRGVNRAEEEEHDKSC